MTFARKYVIIKVQLRERNLNEYRGQYRKGKVMNEEMNQAEVAREETEAKMIYKFLLLIKESKDLEELEQKTRALLNK